jgi:hypothetical protein
LSEEKTNGGLSSLSNRKPYFLTIYAPATITPAVSAALVLLENYTNAFKYDDIHLSVQEELKTIRETFCDHPIAPLYDPIIDILIYLREKAYYSFDEFKVAVDDFDSQYLKICSARKELFTWDSSPGDPGCNIQIDEAPLHDELIDWNFDEPHIGPASEAGSAQWYHH